MKRKWLWTFALILGIVATAMSGTRYVSGPVSGKWDRGTRVIVESQIWVADGEALVVEEGVEIEFLTKDPFVIDGNLQMVGSNSSQIRIKPADNWDGMLFSFDRDLSSWHVLSHVVVETSGSIAKRIIETDRVAIRIDHCEFVSQQNSIRIVGGLIQASDNSFLTYGKSSEVVDIENLNPHFTHIPESRSYLKRNLIQIDGESPHSTGSSLLGAFGLVVKQSTDLIISENAIQLWKVAGASTGVDFSDIGVDDTEPWVLDSCVVKVVTEGYWTCAVQCVPSNPSEQHYVDIIKSTFDIAVLDPVPAFIPYVLYADHLTTVYLNSVAIEARSSGDNPVPYSVGDNNPNPSTSVVVEYSVRWHENLASNTLTSSMTGDHRGRLLPYEGGLDPLNGGFGAATDLPPGVSEHEVIADQNPGFSHEGIEGIWTSHDQVAAYYGLLASSPCREAGDPNLDEGTTEVPDAGRYEFIVTAIDDPVSSILPVEFVVANAYPNPFNPSTTIPLQLAQSAHIQMTVYDILGRVAGEVLNRRMSTGQHFVEFNGANLASGVYLLNVEYNGEFAGSQRLVLLK